MRAFALGLVLVACGGGPAEDRAALAGSGGSAGAIAATGGDGSAGTATSAAGESGEAGEGGSAGAVDDGEGGQAGNETGAGGSGSAGRSAGGAAGSHAVGGSSGGGGVKGVAGSGSAGGPPVVTDPLAPFPAPGCPGFTAYRIPQGKYLAVTGSFELLNLKNGVCAPPSGDPHYERCAALGNVKQCVCTVTSPPTCGQSCDGDYYVAVVRAEPGEDLLITLNDGNGACVAGVPTKVVN